MTISLESLNARIEILEDRLERESQNIEDLEFDITSQDENVTSSLIAHSSGNMRKWRETRDFRGAVKYSNWSVTVVIKNESGQPVKCDWIQITNCNYRIKQSGIVTESDTISFTTEDGQGWDNCSFHLSLKAGGTIASTDISLA